MRTQKTGDLMVRLYDRLMRWCEWRKQWPMNQDLRARIRDELPERILRLADRLVDRHPERYA